MEIIAFLVDFILNVDVHLEAFVHTYGAWVYALLFLIIFVETGVVVMPFLPGDSLLFVVGAMCGVGLMNYPLSVGLLFAAAVLANGKVESEANDAAFFVVAQSLEAVASAAFPNSSADFGG